MNGTCYNCGIDLTFPRVVNRNETCPSCDRDIRVCRNCRFYSPGSNWDCTENIPEAVRDKERGNFCDYFSVKPSTHRSAGDSDSDGKKDQARKAFENLFSDD